MTAAPALIGDALRTRADARRAQYRRLVALPNPSEKQLDQIFDLADALGRNERQIEADRAAAAEAMELRRTLADADEKLAASKVEIAEARREIAAAEAEFRAVQAATLERSKAAQARLDRACNAPVEIGRLRDRLVNLEREIGGSVDHDPRDCLSRGVQ